MFGYADQKPQPFRRAALPRQCKARLTEDVALKKRGKGLVGFKT